MGSKARGTNIKHCLQHMQRLQLQAEIAAMQKREQRVQKRAQVERNLETSKKDQLRVVLQHNLQLQRRERLHWSFTNTFERQTLAMLVSSLVMEVARKVSSSNIFLNTSINPVGLTASLGYSAVAVSINAGTRCWYKEGERKASERRQICQKSHIPRFH